MTCQVNTVILFLSFLLVLIAFDSYAGIIIGGTRVIYQGDKKESSISIRNPDNTHI